MEDDNSPVVEIDPKGDVVLVLNMSHADKRLLVSSNILSMVSPVFAAMFSSQFKEGLQNVMSGIPSNITLPDDDAIAFEIICNVVHHQHKHVPVDLPLEQVVSIATIADKYELLESLYGYSVLWLQSGIKNCGGKPYDAGNWNKLLFIAYILDIPGEFLRISWEIILQHAGPCLNLPGITDRVDIRHNIIAEFDARLAKLRTDLVNAVGAAIYKPIATNICSGNANAVSKYLKGLAAQRLWPLTNAFKDQSVLCVYNKLVSFEPYWKRCGIASLCFCNNTSFIFGGILRDWKDTAFAPHFGICLDCVKTGRDSLRKKQCRVKHTLV
ncbi:hypothetical protein MMC26_007619 [Xylographa opegraphella]|nr:hypothetical protein [Xylographa opegraphella]